MISRFLAALAVAAPLWAAASAPMEMPARTLEGAPAQPMAFRAPGIAPIESASLPALEDKAARASPEVPSGPLRVATVRALPKVSQIESWTPIAGGYVAVLRACSEGALGMSVKLDLGSLARAIEARVQGSDGRVEFMRVEPSCGSDAWLPWTQGSSQVVELFSTAVPREDAVRIAEILHFTELPFAKAAASSCTVPARCATNDSVLDTAIAERKKSVFKMTFVDSGSGFACTGTLINTERFPAPFILTANHCINNVQSAASVNTFWFYENVACDDPAINPAMTQLSGGAVLIFTNSNVDSTLLRMNDTPPPGAVYASWNRALLENGASIVSLSHPRGDAERLALGHVTTEYRLGGHAPGLSRVGLTRGLIQGGSRGPRGFYPAWGKLPP